LWPRLGQRRADGSFAFMKDHEQIFDDDKMDSGTPAFNVPLKRIISSKIPSLKNNSTPGSGDKIPKQKVPTKNELIDMLLECSMMRDRQTRDSIVDELPSDIKSTIKRHSAERVDVSNIVSRCMDFKNGISSLIENLERVEGSSEAMKHLKSFY
ncbi:MAG: hypothetical protein PVI90_07675, partial [Desulfobacteraceae bacterium]|jgi:hypothetical protein